MEIPIKEIEYLASFVEADTENDLYEISEAVMAQVNIVRGWLKAVEHTLAPDGLHCPVCQQVAGTYLACSYCHSEVTPAGKA